MLVQFAFMLIIILFVFIYFMNLDKSIKEEGKIDSIKIIKAKAEAISEAKTKAKFMSENIEEILNLKFKQINNFDFYEKKLHKIKDKIYYLGSYQFKEDLQEKLTSKYTKHIYQYQIDEEYISNIEKIEKELVNIKKSIFVLESQKIDFIPESWEKLDLPMKIQLQDDGISPLNLENLKKYTYKSGEVNNLKSLPVLETLTVEKSLSSKDLFFIFSLPNIKKLKLIGSLFYFYKSEDLEVPKNVYLDHLEMSVITFFDFKEKYPSLNLYTKKLTLNKFRINNITSIYAFVDANNYCEELEITFCDYISFADEELIQLRHSYFSYKHLPKNIQFKFKNKIVNLKKFEGKNLFELYEFLYVKNDL